MTYKKNSKLFLTVLVLALIAPGLAFLVGNQDFSFPTRAANFTDDRNKQLLTAPETAGTYSIDPLNYLAGYTGYPNLIHIKPAMTVHPTRPVSLRVALASQWRESVADAVYAFPTVPIPNTAGRPGRYTGAYGELRADWKITPHYSASVEAVHYAIGKSIRQAGGHNADFLAIEFRWAW